MKIRNYLLFLSFFICSICVDAAMTRDADIITSFSLPIPSYRIAIAYSDTSNTLFICYDNVLQEFTTSGICLNSVHHSLLLDPEDISISNDGTFWLLAHGVKTELGEYTEISNEILHINRNGQYIKQCFHHGLLDCLLGIGIETPFSNDQIYLFVGCSAFFKYNTNCELVSATPIYVPDYCISLAFNNEDNLFWTLSNSYSYKKGYAFKETGEYIYCFILPDAITPYPQGISHYKGDQFWIVNQTNAYLVEMGPSYIPSSVSDWMSYN